MIHALFHAYAATSISLAIRNSRWMFAVAEMVHLAGLSLLGGAIIVVSARFSGWPIGGLDRRGVWRGLRMAILAGLIIQIGSGVVTSRTFVSEEDLPAPPYGYEVLKFHTSFTNKNDVLETVTLDCEDGGWRVVGVMIG